MVLANAGCQPDAAFFATLEANATRAALTGTPDAPQSPQTGFSGATTPIPTATPENAPGGIVPTPTPTPDNLPDGFYETNWDTRDQVLIPDPGDDRAVLEAYYAPSPVVTYGFITRYLDQRRAVEIGVWQVHHFLNQLRFMAPMLGGGYSADCMTDADRCGKSIPFNPFPGLDEGPTEYWFPSDASDLSLAQQHLLEYAASYASDVHRGFTPDQADDQIRNSLVMDYDTLIAMKSPNDIGRVFCVYKSWTWEQPLIARALVVDTAAVNDYTGIGGTDGVPLGYRITLDPTDRYTHWGAEISEPYWSQLVYGDNAWAILVEDRGTGCPDKLNTIPWPDAQPTPTSSIVEITPCGDPICEVPKP